MYRMRLSASLIYDFSDPASCPFTIDMVAENLGRKARFNNHSKFHYSVAEHCFHASVLYACNRKGALMHDAPEYIMGDLITPIKKSVSGFKELEDLVEADMERRFNYERPEPFSFKVIDHLLYHLEEPVLFPGVPHHYDPSKFNFEIQCWDAKTASKKFLEQYYQLSSE